MAKCDFCGKDVAFGIKVSHSHRRSNRTWKPNVKRVKAFLLKSWESSLRGINKIVLFVIETTFAGYCFLSEKIRDSANMFPVEKWLIVTTLPDGKGLWISISPDTISDKLSQGSPSNAMISPGEYSLL